MTLVSFISNLLNYGHDLIMPHDSDQSVFYAVVLAWLDAVQSIILPSEVVNQYFITGSDFVRDERAMPVSEPISGPAANHRGHDHVLLASLACAWEDDSALNSLPHGFEHQHNVIIHWSNAVIISHVSSFL